MKAKSSALIQKLLQSFGEVAEVNTSKYIALAFSSPTGMQLHDKVEENWPKWLKRVEGASWLRNFKGSSLLRRPPRARTPSGVLVEGWACYPSHAIADFTYATAVWGFGVECRSCEDSYWVREARRHQVLAKANPYGLCGTKANTGMPLMFLDLDEWLETLWNQC